MYVQSFVRSDRMCEHGENPDRRAHDYSTASMLVEVRRDFLAVHVASVVMADAALLLLASAGPALHTADSRTAWASFESTTAGCFESMGFVSAESRAEVASAESTVAGCSVSAVVVPSSAPTAVSSHESAALVPVESVPTLVPAELVLAVVSAVSLAALGSLHRLEEHQAA